MKNFIADLSDLLNSPAYSRIVSAYNRGMITFDEAFQAIVKQKEEEHRKTVSRLRRENREARKAEPKKFLDLDRQIYVTEKELEKDFYSDKTLMEEYPTFGAYLNACRVEQGGTLKEIL